MMLPEEEHSWDGNHYDVSISFGTIESLNEQEHNDMLHKKDSQVVIENIPLTGGGESYQDDLVLEMEVPLADDGHPADVQSRVTKVKKEVERQKKKTALHRARRKSREFKRSRRKINFLNDDLKEMTYGRQIALFFMGYSWYNPRAEEFGDVPVNTDGSVGSCRSLGSLSELSSTFSIEAVEDERPSLERAWAYFEHFALERYIFNKEFESSGKLERAEPGERYLKTKLYRPFRTPHNQLGDFGLGVGLYFSSLRALVVITFVAGLLNFYSILYFAIGDWDQEKEELPGNFLTMILLQGSAICTDTTWVPCLDCNCQNTTIWGRDDATLNPRCIVGNKLSEGEDIFIHSSTNSTDEDMIFALKNECGVPSVNVALANYGTIFFMIAMITFIGYWMATQAAYFDEDEQTAQDYSIVITNPPVDPIDPEEWKSFFERACRGTKVAVCTCAVDNDLLIKTLMERRDMLRMIRNELEPGTSLKHLDLAQLAAKTERDRSWFQRIVAFFMPSIPEHFSRLSALRVKVQGLAQLDYPVTNVFITFETERDQRDVLRKFASNSKLKRIGRRYLFRGDHELDIKEPPEPNTVRWHELNVNVTDKVKQQVVATFATLCSIFAAAVIVFYVSRVSFKVAALTTSILNAGFPEFAKLVTNNEAHAYEVDRQTSLYFKISVFRWVNTAIILTLITPFTSTLSAEIDGSINKVYALFITEIITTNVIQLTDVYGHFKRHILAPRAKTQDAMNLCFQGEEFELAERYTNMTKILFLCLWYCTIYPGAFFMCSLALFINYFTDRFSLMRTWKRSPQLGDNIAKFSRRYFFSLAIAIMAIVSSMFWAGYPFDNLCAVGNETSTNLTGAFKLEQFEELVEISGGDMMYTQCLQDLFHFSGYGFTFPFTPQQQEGRGGVWMTEDQEDIATLFGWSAVFILFIMFLRIVYHSLMGIIGRKPSVPDKGEAQDTPFSEVPAISSYIPEVHSLLFSYPLLAVNTDGLNEDLYAWTDPDRPHSYYDMTIDAEELLVGTDICHHRVFSSIKHWPPGDQPEKKDSNGPTVAESCDDVSAMSGSEFQALKK